MVKEKMKRTTPNKGMEKELLENKESNEATNMIWEDPRFHHLVSDPRFKNLPKIQRKVKIDKRFQGMFTDEKFKVKYEVDKYGRRINKSNSQDLKKYYELDESSEDEDKILEEQHREEKANAKKCESAKYSKSEKSVEFEGFNDDLISDGEEVSQDLRKRLLDPTIDYARGEGRLVTDSSSDEESSEEGDPELYIDHVWGELDADAETTNVATQRLAVCNMDWDRIRAKDLMVLFHSFLPPGGCIISIKIYPSEFGKERMAEEEAHGPIELKCLGLADKLKMDETDAHLDVTKLSQEQGSDAEEGDDYHMEKLRQYQLNRLRYYYAVVECDRPETADKIYKECDGIEYESSATKVDLRFIPNDISFGEDELTDICTEMPDFSSYKPRQFTTTALQQAKVDLTWDETAVERRELSDKLASGKIGEVEDKDLKKIVAYSSEDNDEEDNQNNTIKEKFNNGEDDFLLLVSGQCQEKKKTPKKKEDMISKYKALLAEINEKEETEKKNKYEMEFSWSIEDECKDKDNKTDRDTNTANSKTSKFTPIEKVLQKRSEKNKKRKEERKKKKWGKNSIGQEDSDLDSIPDGVDISDPYFAEEFSNGDFLNPRKSKSQKKKQMKIDKENNEDEKMKLDELSLLLDDDEESGKQHFSLEKIIQSEQETKFKKKRRKHLKKAKSKVADERKELQDNFEIDLCDDRFKAIYSSPNFNIDPTDPHFRKTKAMEKIIHEKLKRRRGDTIEENAESRANGGGLSDIKSTTAFEKINKTDIHNILLIKSLKRKLKKKSIA